MTQPEKPRFPDISDLNLFLAAIDRQLERIDANENAIERHAQREALLELRDSIEAEHDPV